MPTWNSKVTATRRPWCAILTCITLCAACSHSRERSVTPSGPPEVVAPAVRTSPPTEPAARDLSEAIEELNSPRVTTRDTSEFEARVLALERRRCPQMRVRDGAVRDQAGYDHIWSEDPAYEGAAPTDGTSEGDADIEVTTVSDTLAFATIMTPCHDGGPYNYPASIYVQRNGRVRLAELAPVPRWFRERSTYGDVHLWTAMREIWNPWFEVSGTRFTLQSLLLHRGLGDSGIGAEYTWDGSRFVLAAIRRRDGGAHPPEHVGPFPRVGPPARRCDGAFAISQQRDAATLTAYVGLTERVRSFSLPDAGCETHTHTITCGGNVLDPVAEYALVAVDDDWVVLRIDESGQREQIVLRVPRGCDP